MINSDNQILIKNKQGQLTTVGLGMQEKKENKIKEQEGSRHIQEPTKKIEPTKGMPAFYFHREDEEEAMQFKNGQQAQQRKKEQTILEYVIDAIIKQSDLNISESVASRLKRVIDSRLRGVRDLLETKEVLVRPVELGGVGLNDEYVRKVLKLIEVKRIKMQEGLEIAEKELLDSDANDNVGSIAPAWSHNVKSKPSFAKATAGRQEGSMHSQEPTITKKIPGKVINASQDIVNKKVYNVKSEQEGSRHSQEPTKMQSTKKLMGPIEELANISLNDFRKLGASSKEALNKIKNKIELLADESYDKKSKGVQAWRLSPVYQNYLSLGNTSIEQGKPINDVIKNSGTLTQAEFDAIGDLSEQLNY